MKTKDISDQLVDCAINLALYTLPGGMDADKDARQAYKTLAADMILQQSRSQLLRIIPFRNLQIRCRNQKRKGQITESIIPSGLN